MIHAAHESESLYRAPFNYSQRRHKKKEESGRGTARFQLDDASAYVFDCSILPHFKPQLLISVTVSFAV